MAEYIDFFNVYIMGSTQIFFQFYFFVKILKKKVKFPVYILFTVCAAFVIDFVPAGTILEFGTFVLLLTLGGMLLCHANFKSSILYAALATEMMLLCFGIVKYLSTILYLAVPAALRVHAAAGIVFMLSSEMASLLLTGICYFFIYRYYSCYIVAEMQHIFLVFIPILMIFIMGEYFNSLESGVEIIESAGTIGYLFNHWWLLILHVLGIASLFCILFSYKKLLHSFRLSTQLSLLEQEEHSMKQYVEEAKAHYDETKSFRHDVRNHITVIKELLQNGKMEQAVNYIEDMDEMAENMSFPCSTNHPVVDILVGNKLGIAKSMGIQADCSLLLPYPCGLRDIDICIVLSNALDNAIHACKSMDVDAEKYIRVSGRIQGDFLMMEIENSYQGNSMFKEGTGLSNIKTVAEKYDGAMSAEMRGNVFVLQVLLILPRHSEGVSQQTD
ncbi:MAG: GHKL domain-containing protein [Coprococcus sp.]|nr:GHKL domain-containing protein [Coprococcus sp.]